MRARRGSRVILSLLLVTSASVACTADEDPKAAEPTGTTSGSPGPSAVSDSIFPPPGEEPLPEDTADRLQAVLDEWMAGDNNIGITAALVSEEGTWQGAVGKDGAGEALVPDAAMNIASITKTFVAAEVMKLAGQGMVDLDAPIDDYISPAFDTRGATVRQVLAMRSGFPLDPVESMFEATAEDLDRSWTSADTLAMVDATSPREDELGALSYNNVNYWVLGQMVEQLTGVPLAQSLTRDLIEPAGLQRVWFQDAQQPVAPVAIAEEDPELDIVDEDGSWLPSRSTASAGGAAGGMAADAPSLARWGYLLYGGHVIDPALVEQMTASQSNVTKQDWYGLGTVRGMLATERVVGHDGGTPVNHGLMYVSTGTPVSIALQVPAGFRVPDPEVSNDELFVRLLTAYHRRSRPTG